MDIFGGTIHRLERSLDFASAKNQTISSNISNIDTPNYKAKDISFKDILTDASSQTIETNRTHSKHIPLDQNTQSSPEIITKNNTSYNHNGNNVDVDKEMADLAKNQIYYQALVDRINGKFGSLQSVIRGGN